MRAFDTYPGGKGGPGVYQTIINEQPPHEVYIEPFLGGGAVMRMKRGAARNIGVDLSAAVVEAWRAPSLDMAMCPGEVVQGCGIAFLSSYRWTGRELVYVDPPYVRAVRRTTKDLYEYEMTDEDHRRLLRLLVGLPCYVQVSGYWSDLYGESLSNWRLVRFQAQTRGGRMAEECLWMNYGRPAALHDYRYLGRSFRERERVKRKVGRWAAGLARLPELERRAILSALLAGDIAENDDGAIGLVASS